MSEIPAPSARWTLRDLPFSARLTIAAFLISAGLGYFSALVNLHFQSASPGELLPTEEDVIRGYHGVSQTSQFVRLCEASPHLPFNGQGSMRAAFGSKAGGWDAARKRKAKEMKLDLNNPEDFKKVNEAVQQDLEGERLVTIWWARMQDAEVQKQNYEEDRFPLVGELAKLTITPRFVEEEEGQRFALIKSIISSRCARCHRESAGDAGSQYPLDKYEEIALYLKPEGPTGKSLAKLALTTHVHLLGFSMLYGLTGLVFALTNWPGLLRLLLAPLPLVAQVADISFWWLARLDGAQGEMFARFIPISGGIVALGLGLQILLTLWSLFGYLGRLVLLLLVLAAGFGAFQLKGPVLDYLEKERAGMVSSH